MQLKEQDCAEVDKIKLQRKQLIKKLEEQRGSLNEFFNVLHKVQTKPNNPDLTKDAGNL